MARLLILTGIIFITVGIAFLLLGKLNIPFVRFPGDIYITKKNFIFFFPVVTCLIASVILTFVMRFLGGK
ncbi:MAG: DUF2905 domain-containing protein [Candidatus Omnitrophica bacterium]|nr:DUF2905 domain-containing protein [Candidatus Omnitrophota bacterium]MDD5081538.1 DUF2905 domain-containing protein [Candidatus Omnitrophota bacterium]MDD5440967.1 DUF2905 domain-containing protein [Candidatus Omnitrophota bacterium]